MKNLIYLFLTKAEQVEIRGGAEKGKGASCGQGGLNPIQTTRSFAELGLVNVEKQRQLASNQNKD